MKIRRKATKKEIELIGCNCPKWGKIKPEDVMVEITFDDKDEGERKS